MSSTYRFSLRVLEFLSESALIYEEDVQRILCLKEIMKLIPIMYIHVYILLASTLDLTLGVKVEFDVCIAGEPAEKVYGLSPVLGVRKCRCTETCAFVTYNRMLALCKFFEGSPDAKQQNCAGSILYSVSDEQQTDVQKLLYNANEDVCFWKRKLTCPEPVIQKDLVLLGNTNHLESKRAVTCSRPYAVDGADVSTCTESGSWSQMGNCSIFCGTPIVGKHMNMGIQNDEDLSRDLKKGETEPRPSIFFENATLVIECLNGTVMHGSSIVRCVNGSWTTMPECKLTMRRECQSDSECLDKDSECRNDRCWFKPRLSYDFVSLACVKICPGQYRRRRSKMAEAVKAEVTPFSIVTDDMEIVSRFSTSTE